MHAGADSVSVSGYYVLIPDRMKNPNEIKRIVTQRDKDVFLEITHVTSVWSKLWRGNASFNLRSSQYGAAAPQASSLAF